MPGAYSKIFLWVKSKLSAPLFTALLSALVGSFVGSYTSYRFNAQSEKQAKGRGPGSPISRGRGQGPGSGPAILTIFFWGSPIHRRKHRAEFFSVLNSNSHTDFHVFVIPKVRKHSGVEKKKSMGFCERLPMLRGLFRFNTPFFSVAGLALVS